MIRDNLFKIRERISTICSKINRDPQTISIVAVSKDRGVCQIQEVIAQGITDIGENRIQEARIKYNDMRLAMPAGRQATSAIPIKWHMVGHLQTNKVKEAVKVFHLIHSVDSLHLAKEIDKQANKINKIQDILIEVKTSQEATKFGLPPEEVSKRIKEICQLKNIKIKGLMTIAPAVTNPEDARPYFRTLKKLLNEINDLNENSELNVLSMGMTDDFEVAIEEGANMVRIGRAIFEG